MGLLGFLKKPSTTSAVTAIASTVVSAYNPALGSLVSVVGNAVYQVETDMAGAPGTEKQTAAAGAVAVASANNPKLKAASQTLNVKDLINAIVQLFNVVGIFNHQKTPAPNAPAASTTAPAAAK